MNKSEDKGHFKRSRISGYKPVLLREDVKNALFQFRANQNLTDSHMERCLVTSALALLLNNPDLRDRWMAELGVALKLDANALIPG